MPAPKNLLKAALLRGDIQVGVWLGLGSGAVAEMAAGAGFDWCLIDAEHSPNVLPTIGEQLRSMNGRGTSAILRVPVCEDWVIKQMLDLGVQTLLVPMVHDGALAAKAVAATRYPPDGVRGVGAALARASDYSGIPDYTSTANAEICVIVQAESRASLDNIDAIAGTAGVDAVFIGPADLAADMGHLGNPAHPEVQGAIDHMIARIRAAGKVAGTLTFDPAQVPGILAKGVTFLGVGSDVTTLARGLRSLAAEVRG
ncbi:HpcH/HpaI aldolase/citrate lyase family protein [Anianabacter salinae]|uniref:HpcH/HpaI aldolase/citrate lyase family protein n=1 Tax=Anianabacter salinae TaxID=2851023 RepID=UPI00225E2BF8|nr:HpcH/HpaI aldolase/citrate lyase family protein [Anianabacter salinae]MBV0912090.1 HpcH/HpaI aldolase/citrate lyase family protein [Anianabacter salinae]